MTEHATGESSKLVRMANQIASYFHAYPDATAVESIRNHLKLYWTPRMLRDLQSHGAEPTMDPLVRSVLPLLG